MSIRLVCLLLSITCMFIGVTKLMEIVAVAYDPAMLSTTIECDPNGCNLKTDPVGMLGPVSAAEARTIPSAAARISERISEPQIHLMLLFSALLIGLPAILMYAALGLAMHKFAQARAISRQAVKWLKWAAIAAAASVIAKPLSASLIEMALRPALGDEEGWRFVVIGSDVPFDLLLCGVVWVAIWVLDEGLKSRDELGQYV